MEVMWYGNPQFLTHEEGVGLELQRLDFQMLVSSEPNVK